MSSTMEERERRTFGKYLVVSMLCLFVMAITVPGCSSRPRRGGCGPVLGENIVGIATKYTGAPYEYGGTTPRGFDCSGFTSFVFKQAGISIPRTARAQFDKGARVSKSRLTKGDLVFFTKWSFFRRLFGPSHFGIYISNNKFIHAPSSREKVRVDTLSNTHWKKRFKGARDLR